ncbi:MAG TPA: cobalamin-dependent protein [Candidatus Limnocylindrales bacterium]|nr:cobalamin-dependent protein [Candidatus Limnocylindrales bacterium]
MAARAKTPGDELLTLHEAANRLGVHYMTVYRRVRLGMLPAHKVGGSWRIEPADLAGQRSTDPAEDRPAGATPTSTSTSASPRRRRAPWVMRLQQRMLAGDGAGSWQVVEAAMASGVEPQDVYVELLGPALHEIGSAWERGEIGIADEHLASGVAASIVGRMGPRFRRRGRHRGTVLVAMPAGERHGLGVAMLADILSQAGFEVLNLGPDTPPESLQTAMAARDDLSAVVISVVSAARLPGAARLVAAARRSNRDAAIVAGGFAVSDQATAQRLGADGWVADPRQLAQLISELSS